MAELKAQKDAIEMERERVNFDADTWRTQMNELERELEASATKARAQLGAAREETERHRRTAYEMQAAVNKLKVRYT